MRAILTVFAKEFRENLRERRTLFSALLLGPVLVPLLFYFLLGLQIRHNTGSQDQPVALAVAHAERAPQLMQALTAAGITVQPVALRRARSARGRAHAPAAARARGRARSSRATWGPEARRRWCSTPTPRTSPRPPDTERVRAAARAVRGAHRAAAPRGARQRSAAPRHDRRAGRRRVDAGDALGGGPGHAQLHDPAHHADGRHLSGDRRHRRGARARLARAAA